VRTGASDEASAETTKEVPAMSSKLRLAFAAVLALSGSAAWADSHPEAQSCSYDVDVTRAAEPAPSGCPVASWDGGGYDTIAQEPIFAFDATAPGASEPAPEVPRYVAQLWMGP